MSSHMDGIMFIGIKRCLEIDGIPVLASGSLKGMDLLF
jgi:hypothetical protein